MNSNDFVVFMKSITPSYNDLKKQGLSEEYIKKELDSYFFSKKTLSIDIENPLLSLIANYEVSTFEVGMISLFEQATDDFKYYYVGKVEIDLLCIEKNTGEVIVLDGNDKRTLLWRCSKDGGRFLDAVANCSVFFVKRSHDDSLWNDPRKILDHAELIAETAGGKVYLDFYKMILGYF